MLVHSIEEMLIIIKAFSYANEVICMRSIRLGGIAKFHYMRSFEAPIFDEDFNLILKSRPQHNHFQIRYIQTIISINTKETEIGDRLDGWCSDLLFVDVVGVFHTRALNLL